MGPFAAVALLSLALPGAAQPLPNPTPRPSAARLAQAAPNLVRKESKYWTYYVPDASWNGVGNANGIDITDKVGDKWLGAGYSGTPGPVTFEQMLEFSKQYGSLDAHPIKDLRLGTPTSPVREGPGIYREVDYTAVRTDTGQPVTGHIKIEIFRNDATGVYAYGAWARTTPTPDAAKWQPVLAQMQHLLFYHPQPAAPDAP